MFCNKCGVELLANSAFCQACGNNINEPLHDAPEQNALLNLELQYAGFWLRLIANFFDGLILLILGAILGYLIGFFIGSIGAIYNLAINVIEIAAELGGGLAGLILNWIYFTAFESSTYQATFGKQILGIKVIDIHGQKLSFGKANARYFGKILSTIILFIGFFVAGVHPKKQALHDIIAGTLVIIKSKN